MFPTSAIPEVIIASKESTNVFSAFKRQFVLQRSLFETMRRGQEPEDPFYKPIAMS